LGNGRSRPYTPGSHVPVRGDCLVCLFVSFACVRHLLQYVCDLTSPYKLLLTRCSFLSGIRSYFQRHIRFQSRSSRAVFHSHRSWLNHCCSHISMVRLVSGQSKAKAKSTSMVPKGRVQSPTVGVFRWAALCKLQS
jgi:hypothetical protein